VFLCCNRWMTVGTLGLAMVAAWFVQAESAQALNSAPPVVPSTSDAQTSSVLASTRNASLAAAKLVGAGTAGSPLTLQDFEEIAVIDASVLDTPLDANEQAEGRDTIATQYRQNPTAFVKSLEIALADLRWDALRGVIGFGLQAKAVEIMHQNVHSSKDIPMGARHLENAAIQFDQGLAQFNKQMAARTIAIMGGVGQGAVVESMNMAQDRFEGKFDANPHH
jgi:hypothetical protein